MDLASEREVVIAISCQGCYETMAAIVRWVGPLSTMQARNGNNNNSGLRSRGGGRKGERPLSVDRVIECLYRQNTLERKRTRKEEDPLSRDQFGRTLRSARRWWRRREKRTMSSASPLPTLPDTF